MAESQETEQSPVPIYSEKNKEAVVIEVKNNLINLLNSVVVDEYSPSGMSIDPSIYKIPEFMKGIDGGKAFKPQLVSFGPYHHGETHLLPMEKQKRKAFWRFINEYGVTFESIVQCVSNNLEYLLGAYDKLDENWKNENAAKFVELMILDGCFMLDFFENCPKSLSTLSSDIRRDMLLLENQLPFILLQQLYAKLKKKDDIIGLKLLICEKIFIEYVEAIRENNLHILEMYRASLLYPPIDRWDHSVMEKTYARRDQEWQIIPQTTQLREARIKFKTSSTTNLTDVSFDPKQGVLKLPHLVVDDDSETILLNVMAFEKLHVQAESKVTSFVILMNNLVDEHEDVALLASNNILSNMLRNDQEAANLFNLLGKGATMVVDSQIADVQRSVNRHCSQPWNTWYAILKRNYFRNPWAIISLLGAILGYAIVIVQVVYQIVDFHRGN